MNIFFAIVVFILAFVIASFFGGMSIFGLIKEEDKIIKFLFVLMGILVFISSSVFVYVGIISLNR